MPLKQAETTDEDRLQMNQINEMFLLSHNEQTLPCTVGLLEHGRFYATQLPA